MGVRNAVLGVSLVALAIVAVGADNTANKPSPNAGAAIKPLPVGTKPKGSTKPVPLTSQECAKLGGSVTAVNNCRSGIACYNTPAGGNTTYAVCID